MKETYLNVWGVWLLPPDLCYSLEDVRNWAKRRGLAGEERFIGQETLQELRRFYPDHTRVGVLIHLNRDPAGRITYEERPFISVAALIMRNEECRIVRRQLFSLPATIIIPDSPCPPYPTQVNRREPVGRPEVDLPAGFPPPFFALLYV